MNRKFRKTIILLFGGIIIMALSSVVSAGTVPAGIVNIGDYVTPGTGVDVSAEIQAVIDANPNRTIFFPDGEYLFSSPVATPADPAKSVDLQLSNYAVIKAADDFSGEALIRLGGKDAYNTTKINGSNYSLTGGIIDGSDIANGITIESGRETKVQNTSVKHTVIGLYIKYGANSGSSDCDIRDINIIGSGTKQSVGMLIEGYDNTFTNIRIGYVYIGVILRSGGNSLTNIHPLYQIGWDNSEGSCGFVDESSNNLYTYCYSDQFETCFKIIGNGRNIYTDCFGFWWSGDGKKCRGFLVEGDKFNSVVTNLRIDFRGDTDNTVYDGPVIGSGKFVNLLIDGSKINPNIKYRFFVNGGVISIFKSIIEKFKRIFFFIGSLFR